MTAPAARVRAFDWLRGLAVLFMIQCHALSLLTPQLRAGVWAQRLVWLDGLVAPSFIFSAGFSLALVQVRGAAAGTRGMRFLKTLRRLAEVLFVATLVNAMWFRIFDQPVWILRMDILQCIGVSLLVALPFMSLLARRPTWLRAASLALALLAFALTPFGEIARGRWAWPVQPSNFAPFPLLPWAGYVYLGASAGATAATGDLWRVARWLIGLGALGLALWKGLPHLASLYAPASTYVPSNHGNRLFILAILVLALLALEYPLAGAWQKSFPVRFVETFGASSLAGYFFHQWALYAGPRGVSFHSLWGDRSGWGQYWLLTCALIALTYALVRNMDIVYRVYDTYVRRAMDGRHKLPAPLTPLPARS